MAGNEYNSPVSVHVNIVNDMLRQLQVPKIIHSISEISPAVFVTLYEGLCGEPLKGIVRQPRSLHDEVKNAQTVIDSLSLDILHTSLSHISAEDIAHRDPGSVANLVEVFSGLMEYILSKIESEVQEETESLGSGYDAFDPDHVSSKIIDDIIAQELDNTKETLGNDDDAFSLNDETKKDDAETKRKVAWLENDDDEDERPKDYESHIPYGVYSPPVKGPKDVEVSGSSTIDLIRESEQLEKILQCTESQERNIHMDKASEEKLRTDLLKPQSDSTEPKDSNLTGKPPIQHHITHHLYHHFDRSRPGDVSVNMSDRNNSANTRRRLCQSLPVPSTAKRFLNVPVSEDAGVRKSKSFESLISTVEETVNLARHAVETSPLSEKGGKRNTGMTDREAFLSKALRSKLKDLDAETKKIDGLSHSLGETSRKTVHSSTVPHISSYQYYRDPERLVATDLFPDSKHVHFTDLSRSREENLSTIRKQVEQEAKDSEIRKRLLEKIYENEYKDILDEAKDRLSNCKAKAGDIAKKYNKEVQKGPKINPPPKKKKGPTSPLRSRQATRIIGRERRRSASSSPQKFSKRTQKNLKLGDNDLLPLMLDHFPYLQISPETMHDLWRKSAHQIEIMTKAEIDVKSRKSRAQKQLEEALRRQEILSNIIRKEMSHSQRMKDLQHRNAQKKALSNKLHEQRIQSARARKYYENFDLKMRAKMLKKRTKEEQIFKSLFKEGLDIQRDRLRELRKYAKEQREKKSKVQQDEIDSLENFYRDQFAILAESMDKERKDVVLREEAQAKVIDQMKKELRKKMETEIRDFQDQLQRDEDDVFYRQLDADRLLHDLYRASLKTKI